MLVCSQWRRLAKWARTQHAQRDSRSARRQGQAQAETEAADWPPLNARCLLLPTPNWQLQTANSWPANARGQPNPADKLKRTPTSLSLGLLSARRSSVCGPIRRRWPLLSLQSAGVNSPSLLPYLSRSKFPQQQQQQQQQHGATNHDNNNNRPADRPEEPPRWPVAVHNSLASPKASQRATQWPSSDCPMGVQWAADGQPMEQAATVARRPHTNSRRAAPFGASLSKTK